MHLSLLSALVCVAASRVFAEQLPIELVHNSTAKRNVLTPNIDNFVESIPADWNSPGGVGIAVVQKGEDGSWNVETKGYGIAKADGSKVTANTLFAIGCHWL